MQIHKKHCAMAIAMLLALLAPSALGQEPKSIVASAKGEGTIKMGKEEFKVHAVTVKLFEDGAAEINLITDITIFLTGTWSRSDGLQKEIDLKITSMMSEGVGTLFVGADRTSIARLKLEVVNKSSKKTITVDFVAK